MKLYEIKNTEYETKLVVADDMSEALDKYKAYLDEHIGYDWSPSKIFKAVTSCTYIRDYEELDIIR